MIASVKIRNFQRHAVLDLDFAPGVNIIAGSSDQGKSAILKAMRWCLYNEPDGFNAAIRHDPRIAGTGAEPLSDEAMTSVEITFDDGQTIRRERNGKSINRYVLNNAMILTALPRLDTPEEVKTITRMNEYNLRMQFPKGGLFLIQESAPEITRKINDVAGLEIIDQATKRINSIVDNAKTEAEKQKKELGEINAELADLEYLKDIEIIVDRIENGEEKLDRAEADARSLKMAVDELDALETELAELREWKTIAKRYEKIAAKLAECREAKTGLSELDVLTVDLEQLALDINDCHGLIQFDAPLAALRAKVTELAEAEATYTAFSQLIDSVAAADNTVTRLGVALRRHEANLAKCVAKGGICPKCGTELQKGQLERMLCTG